MQLVGSRLFYVLLEIVVKWSLSSTPQQLYIMLKLSLKVMWEDQRLQGQLPLAGDMYARRDSGGFTEQHPMNFSTQECSTALKLKTDSCRVWPIGNVWAFKESFWLMKVSLSRFAFSPLSHTTSPIVSTRGERIGKSYPLVHTYH